MPVWLLTTTITLCTQTLSVPFDLNHSPAAAAEQACVKAVVKFNQKYCWSGWQLATGRSSLGHRRAGGLQEPISGARGAPVYPISALHHTPLHHLRHQLRRNPNPQTQRKKNSQNPCLLREVVLVSFQKSEELWKEQWKFTLPPPAITHCFKSNF